jgi:hypothetical protein
MPPLNYQDLLEKMAIAQAQAQAPTPPPKSPDFIPPFAYAFNHSRLQQTWTLTGLLWVRLERHLRQPMYEDSGAVVPAPIKFMLGKVGIVDAIEAMHEGRQAIAVVIWHDGIAMILHDDAVLFPSDTLVTKIFTLKDA